MGRFHGLAKENARMIIKVFDGVGGIEPVLLVLTARSFNFRMTVEIIGETCRNDFSLGKNVNAWWQELVDGIYQ